MGSPFYMSPEQMRSARDVDHRTDVWSLGVILFELLSGQPPFKGESLPELVASIVMNAPLSLCELRPDISPELQSAVFRALEKDPAQRYQSVGEFAAALSPFAPRRTRMTVERILKVTGANASPLMSEPPLQMPAAQAITNVVGTPVANASAVTAQNTAIPAGTHGSWSETRPEGDAPVAQKKSSPGVWIAMAAAALLMVGGGIFALTQRSADPKASTALAEKPVSGSPTPSAANVENAPVAPTPSPVPPEPTVAIAPAVTPEIATSTPSASAPTAAITRAPTVQRAPVPKTGKPEAKPTSAPAPVPVAAPAPKKEEKKRGLNIDLK
jgi:serine/threonine-protein kinase